MEYNVTYFKNKHIIVNVLFLFQNHMISRLMINAIGFKNERSKKKIQTGHIKKSSKFSIKID